MNIFGAFTFGSLIKTFLPGFAWLAAIVLLEADVRQWQDAPPVLWSYATSKDQAALVLAIPASILLGLLSNIIVFMGMNDRLVRAPVRRANLDLCALYDMLAQRVRDRYWTSLGGADPAFRPVFNANIDPELVLLHTLGVDKLSYVREQYWYHLEFQLNLLLSTGAVALAVTVSILLNVPSAPWRIVLAMASIALAVLAMRGLLAAARKNYARHIAKIATIMAAALYRPEPGDAGGSG
jgi:hypothetical protein